MVTKIYFPRLLAPLSGVLPGLLDFAVGLPIRAIVMLVEGVEPSWALLTLPLWLGASGGAGLRGRLPARGHDGDLPRRGLRVAVLLQLGLFATPSSTRARSPRATSRGSITSIRSSGPVDGLRWALIGTDPRAPKICSRRVAERSW